MFYIIRNSVCIFLLINFILFISKFKIENKPYKIYTVYLGVIVLIEILSRVFVSLGYQNLILSHFYFTGQFIFLSLFYLELLKENYQKVLVKFNLVLVPIILTIYFLINPIQLHQFCLIEILLTSITLISYSTFHFYNMLTNKKEFYLINCGILIYLFGSTVTFLPRNLYVIYGLSFNMVLQYLNIVLWGLYQIFIFLEWKKITSTIINEK